MKTSLKKLIRKQGGPPSGDEFTVRDYMAAYKAENGVPISHPGATKHLNDMLRDGAITVRTGKVNNRSANIYKPA